MYSFLLSQDVEALTQQLESFKEITEGKIGNYETTINGAILKDWLDIKDTLDKEQHARSRDIVQEIVENIKKFTEENRKYPCG